MITSHKNAHRVILLDVHETALLHPALERAMNDITARLDMHGSEMSQGEIKELIRQRSALADLCGTVRP